MVSRWRGVAHHGQHALGRGRVLAGQLVGDVTVVPVELVGIAQVFGQGERGVEVDLRQLLGERPPCIAGEGGVGQLSGQLLALAQELRGLVRLAQVEPAFGDLAQAERPLVGLLDAASLQQGLIEQLEPAPGSRASRPSRRRSRHRPSPGPSAIRPTRRPRRPRPDRRTPSPRRPAAGTCRCRTGRGISPSRPPRARARARPAPGLRGCSPCHRGRLPSGPCPPPHRGLDVRGRAPPCGAGARIGCGARRAESPRSGSRSA